MAAPKPRGDDTDATSHLWVWLAGVHPGEHGQDEGGRLTRPRLTLGYHVLDTAGTKEAHYT